MEALCQKQFLQLAPPTEADPRAEKQRILDALSPALGSVRMALPVMRKLHAVLRDAQWQVTATLAWTGLCWEVVGLAPGNTADRNYGICVDLGSTTVCMRLVNLATGETVCQDSAYNRQIAFGEDILTRVFYSKDNAAALEEIRQATLATFQEVLEGLEEKSGYPVAS